MRLSSLTYMRSPKTLRRHQSLQEPSQAKVQALLKIQATMACTSQEKDLRRATAMTTLMPTQKPKNQMTSLLHLGHRHPPAEMGRTTCQVESPQTWGRVRVILLIVDLGVRRTQTNRWSNGKE